MSTARIQCDSCKAEHILQPTEYVDNHDGTIQVSIYRKMCPACREQHDRDMAEAAAAERQYDDARRLRTEVEELVHCWGAPPGMADAIIDFMRTH